MIPIPANRAVARLIVSVRKSETGMPIRSEIMLLITVSPNSLKNRRLRDMPMSRYIPNSRRRVCARYL